MIIVTIMGGLGNQLFQIGYALNLADYYEENIYLDLSWYKKNSLRKYQLDELIQDSRIIGEVKYKNKFNKIRHKLIKIMYRTFNKINKLVFRNESLGEKLFHFLSRKGLYFNFDRYYYSFVNSNRVNKYIFGYFQSTNYMNSNFISNIRKKLQDSYSSKINYNLRKNKVAVSMRLGDDYINSKDLFICDEKYYINSIKILNDKTKVFYIFSDEIEKSKKFFHDYFPSLNVIFVEHLSIKESLFLMSNMNYFIIPNSSFAWWGYHLCSEINRNIIYPEIWYKSSKNLPDIYTCVMVSNNMERDDLNGVS